MSGFALLAGQITGISLKAMNSSIKILKMIGPALSRMKAVIVSARTAKAETRQKESERACKTKHVQTSLFQFSKTWGRNLLNLFGHGRA